MKKLILPFLLLLAIACQKESRDSYDKDPFKRSKSSVLSCDIGSIHNDFMSYVFYDYNVDTTETVLQDFLWGYNVELQHRMDTTVTCVDWGTRNIIKQSMGHSIMNHYPHVVVGIISNSILIYNDIEQDSTTFSELLLDLYSVGALDAIEYGEMEDLRQFIESVYLGNYNASSFAIELSNFYTINQNGNNEMLSICMSIGEASEFWWNNNVTTPSDIELPIGVGYPYPEAAIPVAVAMDLAGGMISGATAAVGQYVITGDVNWGTVGWSALGGAINSSTGMVGRLGRFISSFF